MKRPVDNPRSVLCLSLTKRSIVVEEQLECTAKNRTVGQNKELTVDIYIYIYIYRPYIYIVYKSNYKWDKKQPSHSVRGTPKFT